MRERERTKKFIKGRQKEGNTERGKLKEREDREKDISCEERKKSKKGKSTVKNEN